MAREGARRVRHVAVLPPVDRRGGAAAIGARGRVRPGDVREGRGVGAGGGGAGVCRIATAVRRRRRRDVARPVAVGGGAVVPGIGRHPLRLVGALRAARGGVLQCDDIGCCGADQHRGRVVEQHQDLDIGIRDRGSRCAVHRPAAESQGTGEWDRNGTAVAGERGERAGRRGVAYRNAGCRGAKGDCSKLGLEPGLPGLLTEQDQRRRRSRAAGIGNRGRPDGLHGGGVDREICLHAGLSVDAVIDCQGHDKGDGQQRQGQDYRYGATLVGGPQLKPGHFPTPGPCLRMSYLVYRSPLVALGLALRMGQ